MPAVSLVSASMATCAGLRGRAGGLVALRFLDGGAGGVSATRDMLLSRET